MSAPRIRLAEPSDAAACLAIYAPIVRDTAISFEVTPPDAAELAARIAATLERWPWLIAEDDDGRCLGYAYAGAHRQRAAYAWCAEVSVYVDGARHRRGVGRRIYGALLACLQALGYRNAYAGVALPNDQSVAFHRALGFTPVGTYVDAGYKHGAWHSISWWQRRLGPDDGRPPAPPCATLDPALVARVIAGATRAGRGPA